MSIDDIKLRLSREDAGIVMDALMEHRESSRERKLGNANSSSGLRADTCTMLIVEIGKAAAPPLTKLVQAWDADKVPENELREELQACYEDWAAICTALGGERLDPVEAVKKIEELRTSMRDADSVMMPREPTPAVNDDAVRRALGRWFFGGGDENHRQRTDPDNFQRMKLVLMEAAK